MGMDKDIQPKIGYDKTYNPYEDPQLVETRSEESVYINTREPFNNAVKHGDIIVGHQRNRTLSDYPRKTRPWVRLYAIFILVILFGSLIWNFVH